MTTERECQLLERCLRLEATIARLNGETTVELPPIALRLPPLVPPVHGRQRRATAAEIATMRALRARGYSYNAIGRSLKFSNSTARHHTADVLREMGAA